MIIIPECKVVLITPPRTGSTSLLRAAQEKYPHTMSIYRHMEADGIPTGYETWERYGVVRHPISRLWSIYNYCLSRRESTPWAASVSVSTWGLTFEDWVCHGETFFNHPIWQDSNWPFDPRYHILHQMPEQRKSLWWYVRPDLGTMIVPVEELDNFATRRLGLKLPSHEINMVTGIDGSVKAHVAKFFAWDLALYGRK